MEEDVEHRIGCGRSVVTRVISQPRSQTGRDACELPKIFSEFLEKRHVYPELRQESARAVEERRRSDLGPGEDLAIDELGVARVLLVDPDELCIEVAELDPEVRSDEARDA
jgi:hypothetical protein